MVVVVARGATVTFWRRQMSNPNWLRKMFGATPQPQYSQVSIHVSQADGTSPQFKTAQQACRSILPAPSNADLAAQAQQQRIHGQELLAFARCLRGRGINGFPDPNAQGDLSLQMIQAAGIDLTAPKARAAGLACASASNGAISRADVIQATSGNLQPSGGNSASSTTANP